MTEPFQSRPGVLLEILGQGILLQGESGVGKSDLALGLVDRGHRLVADDMVEFYLQAEKLYGRCRLGFEGFIEVTDLGLVNLKRIYDQQAVLDHVPLDLVLILEKGRTDEYDHLRPVVSEWQLMGVCVPAWCLPCSDHRNLPLIVETAARLNRAQRQGYDASADLQSRLAFLLTEGAV